MAVVAGLAALAWALYRSGGAEAAPADLPGILPSADDGVFDRRDVERIVMMYDIFQFQGWFSQGNRKQSDMVAIFAIESNFNPAAIGDHQLEDKSWGIGQVRGTTAGDYGITDPSDLLNPMTGILVAMKHAKWSHDFLKERLGRAPNFDEWIGSYNAGVGAVLRGYIPRDYVARWMIAAGRA